MAKSVLYTAKKKPTDDKKKRPKTTNQTFKSKEDAAQYQKDLKAPLTRVEPRKPKVKFKPKKLQKPTVVKAKQSFTGKDGKTYTTKTALYRANARYNTKSTGRGL